MRKFLMNLLRSNLLFVVFITIVMTLANYSGAGANIVLKESVDDFEPHAFITSWAQESNVTPGINQQKLSLPIYVRIAFNPDPNMDYVNDYFKYLNRFDVLRNVRPTKHEKFRDEFVIQVDASVSRNVVEAIINQTNQHFDSDIERRERLVIRIAKEKIEKEAAAELKRKTEAQAAQLQQYMHDLHNFVTSMLLQLKSNPLQYSSAFDEKRRADEQLAAQKVLEQRAEAEHKQKTAAEEAQLKREADKASRQALRSSAMSKLTPQERLEYSELTQGCSRWAEYFTAMGAQRGSGFGNAIFKYLKDSGSRAALPVLIDQIEAGRVPESYLKLL